MTGILAVTFIVVPLAELAVIALVGGQIGYPLTLLILLLVSVAGAALVKREGRRAWRSLRGALGSGQLPGREVADGALVLVGGALLLTPGFLTDALGLLVVLPGTRPLARRVLLAVVARRAVSRARRGRGRTTVTVVDVPPTDPPSRREIDGGRH